MDLKKATAAESKAIEQRSVHSHGIDGIIELTFRDENAQSKEKGYAWEYDDDRLEDLLDALDAIEDEWRNQKNLTNKEDIPIYTSVSSEGDGFISCEEGCVIVKWVDGGKETVYEKFDNLDNFSQFTDDLHFALIWARDDVEDDDE